MDYGYVELLSGADKGEVNGHYRLIATGSDGASRWRKRFREE
jgi:hypothetical protein